MGDFGQNSWEGVYPDGMLEQSPRPSYSIITLFREQFMAQVFSRSHPRLDHPIVWVASHMQTRT